MIQILLFAQLNKRETILLFSSIKMHKKKQEENKHNDKRKKYLKGVKWLDGLGV